MRNRTNFLKDSDTRGDGVYNKEDIASAVALVLILGLIAFAPLFFG